MKDKKLIAKFIHQICENDYSEARITLQSVVDEKLKNRIRSQLKK